MLKKRDGEREKRLLDKVQLYRIRQSARIFKVENIPLDKQYFLMITTFLSMLQYREEKYHHQILLSTDFLRLH